MNKVLVVLVFFLISCSIRSSQELSQLVMVPTLYPAKNYFNRSYVEPFFKEKHFGYVFDKARKDTIKSYYTSETTIIEDTVRQFLRNCMVTLSKDSLFFKFTDTPFTDNLFELSCIKSPKGFDVIYRQTFSIADSSYRSPVFKTISSKIFLDKKTYAKGDLLKGKFSFKMAASHSWETKYTDTISIYGFVKATVK